VKRWLDRSEGAVLWRDILLVLLVKCVVLYGLWLMFFSRPLAHHMQVPQDQVGQHLTGSTGHEVTGETHATHP